MNSLHRLLNCEIGEFDCRVITTEYRTHVHCIHMSHLFCNPLVHVIYSGVSGQCSYTIHLVLLITYEDNNGVVDMYVSRYSKIITFVSNIVSFKK